MTNHCLDLYRLERELPRWLVIRAEGQNFHRSTVRRCGCIVSNWCWQVWQQVGRVEWFRSEEDTEFGSEEGEG